jgi:hypothetical protein
MNRDDGVLAIEFTTEHRPDLAGLNVAGVDLEAALEIGVHVLALTRPFEQHAQIVGLAAQGVGQRAVILQPAPPLLDLLRGGLVLPEVRFADALLDFLQFVGRAGGVKDSSADRPRVLRGPDTAGAAPLVAAYRWQMAKGESVSAVAAG